MAIKENWNGLGDVLFAWDRIGSIARIQGRYAQDQGNANLH
jgi:hypothetical protein